MSADARVPDTPAIDPRRYHDSAEDARGPVAAHAPVCLYLETTNRCNLLCTTCPRTYDTLEPEADMSWELFTRIVDQVPSIARVVLHGVGEPMLVQELPRMVRYLKARGAYVLFNTNGTVLTPKKGRELADTGLDELRVSLDAADAGTFQLIRGKDYFNRIVRNVRAFTQMQARERLERPRVSLWLTGLKETIGQLGDFVRIAHDIGIKEVYLQRLVFFESDAIGMARPDQALFEKLSREEAGHLQAAEDLARELGIRFNASGASEAGESLTRKADANPWSLCRRPWTVMYFTANGRALPCCIAPFSLRGYENYTLGDATQATLRDIWNGPAYQSFRTALQSDAPPKSCASCGLRWSL
jgi:MoaA/NifB/PqqE/SkfB family radical SAM enzyme